MTIPKTFSFHIEGINPENWKPTTGGKFRRKDPKLVAYQNAIKEHFWDLVEPVFEKGTPLQVTFWFWRSTKGSKPADATNLQKALEDALNGLVWHDDRHNACISTEIVEQGPKVEPLIGVAIEELPQNRPADNIRRIVKELRVRRPRGREVSEEDRKEAEERSTMGDDF